VITVEIPEIKDLYLIVPYKTVIEYKHQCGGYSCSQRKQEGYLIPLGIDEIGDLTNQLEKYFREEYGGWCIDGLNDEKARKLEEIINREFLIRPEGIKEIKIINHKECVEAWIYTNTGIMIWENSD